MQPCLDLPSPALRVSGYGFLALTIAQATSSSAATARLTPSNSLRSKTASGPRPAKWANQPMGPTIQRIPDRRHRAQIHVFNRGGR